MFFLQNELVFGIFQRSDFRSWNSWQNCEWQADSTSSRRLKTYLPGKKTKQPFSSTGKVFPVWLPGRVFASPLEASWKNQLGEAGGGPILGKWLVFAAPAIWLIRFWGLQQCENGWNSELGGVAGRKSGGSAQGNPWVGWPSAKIKRLNLLSRCAAMEHSSMSKPLTMRLRGCQVFWKDFSWNSQKTTPRKGSWNQAWHIRQGICDTKLHSSLKSKRNVSSTLWCVVF